MPTTPIEPVVRIPPDAAKPDAPEKSIALCLSGGGYRAMLFHTGVLWRLQELGYLNTTQSAPHAADLGPLGRVSSVSGGSITAGLLALKWDACRTADPSPNARVAAFVQEVALPIRSFANVNVAGLSLAGALGVIGAILTPGRTVNDYVTSKYRKHLYRDATLDQITAVPRFVINASNLQSGALWRFTKSYAADWRVGLMPDTRLIGLAQAVSASSAFPPPLSPARLTFKDNDYKPGSGGSGEHNLQRPPFTTRPMLSDGGVYDNLGLETAWKNHLTVLVSDAGKPLDPDEKPGINWVSQGSRVIEVIQSQVRALRVRDLINSFQGQPPNAPQRRGCYWGVGSDVSHYPNPTPLPCPFDKTVKLACVPTDLAEKSDTVQEHLINWGYAICDTALRSWVDTNTPVPGGFPYPSGVG
jgi:NTE family protein